MGSLRIGLGEDEPMLLLYLQEVLENKGHRVVVKAATGEALVEGCKRERPDLLITDIKLAGLDGFQAVERICRESPLPVVFITGFTDRQRAAEAAAGCGIYLYLVKPVGEAEIHAAVALAAAQFRHFQDLAEKESGVSAALAQWQHVERAKAYLMEQAGLQEAEAFERLRALATASKLPLFTAAQRILTSGGC